MNRPMIFRTRCVRYLCLPAIVALLVSSGCGRWAGLAYFMGWGRGAKIEAEYDLPKGKLLVLVDDPREKVQWPQARDMLVRAVGEELLAHKAVTTVISHNSIARFRQADLTFEQRSAQDIGRKLGADTILWLEVREFFAPIEIEDTSTAAKLTVSVKVLTTREETRAGQVRLWPFSGDGYIVETELNAVDVNHLKRKNAVSKELARKSALQIGRLFYQHTLGDIDDDP